MAGYIYNPGESIRRDFQQTQAGLGEIFTQIIQQQQRDYTLAENTFANIEALKKDVNIYGQKSITDKANNLLSYTSNSILKDGKLDYSKVGEVRRAVSDIKDLKIGYDLAAKEYEKALQLGVGSKDDLLSFQKYYSDLGALMSNENLIKNPRDLQAAFSKAYTNNLNGSKKFVDVFKSIAPYSPIEKQITNSKGGITDIKGEVPRGWEIDENSKVSYPKTITITNPDGTTKEIPYIAQITAELNAKDPTLIPLLRAQGGVGASKLSDEDLVGYHLNNTVKVGASAKEIKTKSQLDMEASKAKTEGIQAKYAEDVIKADLKAKDASAASSWASAKYYNKKADQEEVDMMYDPFKDFTKVSFTGGTTGNKVNLTKYPIGKDVTVNVNGRQGKVKSVAVDGSGQIWVEALQSGRDKITTSVDKNDRKAGYKWRKVSNLAEFNTELSQAISVGAGIPVKQQAKIRKAIGTLYNLPKNEPNIPSPSSVKKLGIYKGYNLDILAKDPSNKGLTVQELKAEIDSANK